MSRNQSGVCVFVECRRGVVEGEELALNLAPFFFLLFFFFSLFFFFFFFFIMRSLFLGTRSFVQH